MTASLAVILLLLGGGTLAFSGRSADATPSTVGLTQHFDLKIVALVDYLLLPIGLGCDYGQGSASLVVSQSAANVSLSVQGDVASRAYTVVMITNEGNFSIGTMTVDRNGNGTFSGGAKLGFGPTPSPTANPVALSEVAIRLYYTGQVPAGCFSLDLVGLPFPVIISSSTTTTTTTTTTSTTTSTSSSKMCVMCTSTSTTSSQASTQTISKTVSTTSTSSIQTSTSTLSTQKSTTTTSAESTVSTTAVTVTANVSTSLAFKLVSLPAWLLLPEPLNYPFQSGTANVNIEGNTLHVEITIAGAANTHFIVDLHANNLNITLGMISTTNGGTSSLLADAHLNNGTYLIGIRVYQAPQATAMMMTSSLVGVSIPLADPVVIGSGGTTTTPTTTTSTTTAPVSTTTQTSTESSSQSGNDFSYFSLNLVRMTAMPTGYVQGSGTVSVDLLSGILDVSVQLDHANPNTMYAVVMELGKSNITLGSFVTNSAGNAELDAEVPVSHGHLRRLRPGVRTTPRSTPPRSS